MCIYIYMYIYIYIYITSVAMLAQVCNHFGSRLRPSRGLRSPGGSGPGSAISSVHFPNRTWGGIGPPTTMARAKQPRSQPPKEAARAKQPRAKASTAKFMLWLCALTSMGGCVRFACTTEMSGPKVPASDASPGGRTRFRRPTEATEAPRSTGPSMQGWAPQEAKGMEGSGSTSPPSTLLE